LSGVDAEVVIGESCRWSRRQLVRGWCGKCKKNGDHFGGGRDKLDAYQKSSAW